MWSLLLTFMSLIKLVFSCQIIQDESFPIILTKLILPPIVFIYLIISVKGPHAPASTTHMMGSHAPASTTHMMGSHAPAQHTVWDHMHKHSTQFGITCTSITPIWDHMLQHNTHYGITCTSITHIMGSHTIS